jgi:hypothetical protein
MLFVEEMGTVAMAGTSYLKDKRDFIYTSWLLLL